MGVIHFVQHVTQISIDKIASVIAGTTICQYFWKQKGDLPSGPCDFEGCIWKRARLTSPVV